MTLGDGGGDVIGPNSVKSHKYFEYKYESPLTFNQIYNGF
jgi:hypothetical protein